VANALGARVKSSLEFGTLRCYRALR
jgi:hypothetical protein